MARPTNFGFDRFGGTNTDKPQRRTTPSLIRNRANTNKYKLGDYSADDRFRTAGGMRPYRGTQTPATRGGGFNLGSLGGLLGGRSRSAEFAEQDFERQKELDRLVWERSTPNVTGVGGTVSWDRDKNMVTSTLSPENQAIYNAMIERQKMFGGQVDALAGGGWEDAQQKRFDQMRGMYTESDALAEQQRLAREQATGASSTGRYWGERTAQDVIDARNRGLLNDAFLQSQALIDSGIDREKGAVGMMSDLGTIANTMVKMPSPQPTANLEGMRTGSTRWADNLAMEAFKKKQGQSQFWNSVLGSLFK